MCHTFTLRLLKGERCTVQCLGQDLGLSPWSRLSSYSSSIDSFFFPPSLQCWVGTGGVQPITAVLDSGQFFEKNQ